MTSFPVVTKTGNVIVTTRTSNYSQQKKKGTLIHSCIILSELDPFGNFGPVWLAFFPVTFHYFGCFCT